MRIYLSSTSVDLKQYREAVLAALRRMGHEAAAMEDYGAEDQFPADKCVADVQASELYVGVFAWRYGFVPGGRQVSITEMEYLAAKEKGIPTLIFILDSEVAWPPKFVDRAENAGRIEALRDRLMKSQLVSMFHSPEDLAAKVATAVARAEPAKSKSGPGKPAVNWTLAQLHERARKASEDYFEKMTRQRIFVPSVYTSRADLEGHLDNFADPRCAKTGMIVVGASGTGKTNTLCHWVRRYQDGGARPLDVLLFVGGSTLPGGHFDLRQTILERLEIPGSSLSMNDFLAAFSVQRGSTDAQFIIVIDSVDKHPQPAELMRQIDDLIVLEEVIPWYKVVVSIAEIPYANLRNSGFVPSARDYYGDSSKGDDAYEVRLGLLSPQELMAAYTSYRKEPLFAPASTFAELTDEVRISLRKPLVLRIVMELFHDRQVPDRVLGTEVLFEYCMKKVFRHPDRAFFVNRFVDLLYENRITSAPFDQLAREADLRAALLDHSAESCYMQLLDEQVLEEQTKRVSSILPPQRSVALTYDRLLEYLLLARLVERFGMGPDALIKLSREALEYLPLHGVLTTLLVTKTEEGRPEEAAAVLRDGEPRATRPLARRLFSELEHSRPMLEGGAPNEGPLGRLIEATCKSPTPFLVELLLEAADELQDLGYQRRSAAVYELLGTALPAQLEPRLRALYHRGLGQAKSNQGKKPEGLAEMQAALELYRGAGDKDGEQALLDDIGRIQVELGRMQEALASLTASLEIDRELVERTGSAAAREGEASSRHELAAFYLREGRVDTALDQAQLSLALRRELGERRPLSDSLLQLGRCQRRKKQLDEALASAGEALSGYREVGSKIGVASALAELGAIAAELGRRPDARAQLNEALSMFNAIGRLERVAELHAALGALSRDSEEKDGAVRHFVEALEAYRALGDRAGESACQAEIDRQRSPRDGAAARERAVAS